MANEIDLVVGSEAFAQITKLLVELGKVDTTFTELSAKFAALGSNTNTVKSTADLAKLTAENAKLNAVIEQQIKDFTDLNAKLAQATTARASSTKEITKETIALRDKNAQTTLDIKATTDAVGAYAKLDAQHKIAVKNAQDLAVKTQRTGIEYENAKNKANELGKQLRVIDTDIGKHTRNVGNYSSSWNGLGNSINQLTREAPAFANSVQTGFMALSNNIPILTDELGVLIAKNKALQADGKPTESILKTVAGAFFSWQTAISLGVTILTVYGAKIIDAIFGLSEFEKSQKAVNDEMSKINNTTTVAAVNLKILSNVVLDVTKSEKDRKIALNELKEIIPELDTADINHVSTLKDVIYWTNKYIEASILRAQADYLAKTIAKDQTDLDILKGRSDEDKMSFMQKTYLVLAKLTGQEAKVTEIIKDQIYYEQKDLEAKVRRNTALLKTYEVKASGYEQELKGLNGSVKAEEAANKAADKLAEEAAKKEKERLKNEYEALLSGFERQKEIDKNTLELFNGTIEEKTRLSIQLAQDEINIANIVFNEKKRLAEGDVSLITVATNEKLTAEENAAQENIKRVRKYYEEQTKLAEKYAKQLSEFNMLDTEEYKKYLKDKKKEDDDRKKYLEKTLQEIHNYTKSFASDLGSSLGLKETFDFFINVDEQGKTMWQKLDTEGVSSEEKFRARFNAIAEASQEMFNKMAQMSQAHYEEDYRRLESQKETSLKFAGDSSAAKEKIEADFAKKKKELDKKKFEDEKKISMVNIAIDTAQAVVASLPNIPLSIIVGVLGAVQLGMVAAQQFPAYAEGTDSHRGGMMLVNDGAGSNYQEKVILPSGKVIRPQGRNVLMDAPKGTKVLNHEQQLFEMLQSNNISMSSPQNS